MMNKKLCMVNIAEPKQNIEHRYIATGTNTHTATQTSGMKIVHHNLFQVAILNIMELSQ